MPQCVVPMGYGLDRCKVGFVGGEDMVVGVVVGEGVGRRCLDSVEGSRWLWDM